MLAPIYITNYLISEEENDKMQQLKLLQNNTKFVNAQDKLSTVFVDEYLSSLIIRSNENDLIQISLQKIVFANILTKVINFCLMQRQKPTQ